MFQKFKLTGYSVFSDGKIVYDEDVYRLIKNHSRLIDRLNPRKWVDMTFMAFDILNGDSEAPKRANWKFYIDVDED